MTRTTLRICVLLVVMGCGWLVPRANAAEAWPTRAVTVVVPSAPGGSTDFTARALAARLQAELGQPFVVNNRPGAAANIGAEYAAKSKPDGYTILLATSINVTNMSIYKAAPNMATDFMPVSQIAFVPNVLVVSASLPVRDLREFIDYMKDSRNRIDYASAGTGSSTHLASVLFDKLAGVNGLQVQYKGGAPAVLALLSGEVQASFPALVEVLPQIKAGKVKALGVTTKKRSTMFPELPAIAELVPGYEHALWNGVFVPAGTPPEIVARLNAAIAAIVRQPEFRSIFAEQGAELVGSSSADFRRFVEKEIQDYRALVQSIGIKME